MITITNLDLRTRTVTFTANGQTKTIEGLGDFPSKRAFVEYLESIARTDMPQAVSPLELDSRGMLNVPLSSRDMPEEDTELPR